MDGNTIGRIDWGAVLENLPTTPVGLLSLIVTAVAVVSIALFWNSPHKIRFAAFVLLVIGASAAFYSAARISRSELVPPPEATDSVKDLTPVETLPKPDIDRPTPEPERIERVRTQSFYDRNAHCASSRTVTWSVVPDKGWKIEVTSIKPKVTVKSTQSSFGGVLAPTEDGFQITGRITNNGDCGPFWKDGRGALGVTVSFNEFKEK